MTHERDLNPAGSILLADDHGLVRHGLQLLIAEVLPQLRVQLAGSLAEAVQALQTQRRFDLVLLDLTLSDVHGLAGLHRLREKACHRHAAGPGRAQPHQAAGAAEPARLPRAVDACGHRP